MNIGFIQFSYGIVIAGLAVFVVAIVLLQKWSSTRCHLCSFRKAVLELGDYPLCRDCWNDCQNQRNIQAAMDSTTANEEIAEHYRRHPEP
jgi:hypothetical protein